MSQREKRGSESLSNKSGSTRSNNSVDSPKGNITFQLSNLNTSKCAGRFVSLNMSSSVDLDSSRFSLKNPYDTSIIHPEYHNNIPTIEPKKDKYLPMPYTFRYPVHDYADVNKKVVKCPPFHVQLDHALAVVWTLYMKDEAEKPLGINQLQWAWAFLNNVRNRHGSHSVDLTHCLETLTDALMEQYADLVDESFYRQSAVDVSFTDVNANSTAVEEDSEFCTYKAQCGNEKCKGMEGKSKAREEDDTLVMKSKSNHTFMDDEGMPFSVNYSDMINRTLTEDTVEFKSKDSCSCRPRSNERKSQNGSVSSFLAVWRKDQMKKILAELERLHSIENYISSTGKNFEPYMDEKDREMHLLLSEKIDKAKKKVSIDDPPSPSSSYKHYN